MNTLPVYDIVLLLPSTINRAAIALSEQLSSPDTYFTLNDTDRYPHISLYMANFTAENLAFVRQQLEGISRRTPAQKLTATRYQRNEHGMFEVFFEKTETIVYLQEAVIAVANPLREGLREKDPVGRIIADYRKIAPEEAKTNIEHYGYDEIGQFFKPHITFTRFKPDSPAIDEHTLPIPGTFSGQYTTLALCEMGEHGTCTKLIELFRLQPAA